MNLRPDTSHPRPHSPSRRQALGLAAALAGGLGSSACSLLAPAATVPMATRPTASPCTGRADTLVVLLPGAYSEPAEFEREGFIRALHHHRVHADTVVAHAHLGYLYNGSVVERLHADVIAPARAQGYRRTWLVGISLGGYVAMAYAAQHGAGLAGIVALAPYLGRPELLRAIGEAGGPAAWRAQAQPRWDGDMDHAVWQWLTQPAPTHSPLSPPLLPPFSPPLYLGYGTEDRLAEGHRLLAGLLPAERIDQVPGGHDWPPWRDLWQRWLARGLLPGGCAGGPAGPQIVRPS